MITVLDAKTLDFIAKKKLTFNQFCICLLLYHEDVAGILKYTNEVGFLGSGVSYKPDGKTKVHELDDLIDRGYLIDLKIDKNNPTALDNYRVSEKFTKDFLADDSTALELWNLYPRHLSIQGRDVPAKACDYEEFRDKYLKVIARNLELHSDIISKLQAYKRSHQYAEMTILKFVGSRHWENLNEQSKQGIRLH